MTIKELLTQLDSILPNSKLSVESDLLLDEDDDLLFRIIYTNNEAAFILLSFQVYFSKSLLLEKIKSLQSPIAKSRVEIEEIKVFLQRKNIKLLPFLKEYNKKYTDYDRLAELYLDCRGEIIGKRFGF
jgi:hypothetical protein